MHKNFNISEKGYKIFKSEAKFVMLASRVYS